MPMCLFLPSRYFLFCLLIKKPIRLIPASAFVILNLPLFFPLCINLLLIVCEINHDCLVPQHENCLAGIYPDTPPMPVCLLAVGLGQGRDELSSQAQGPRASGQSWRPGRRALSPACSAADGTCATMQRLRTSAP